MSRSYWLEELRHSWPILQGSNPTEIATAPLALAFDKVSVRLGVDGGAGRHLLVPVSTAERPVVDLADSTLATRLRTYTFARRPRRYLDIVCSRVDLADLFDEVLLDILLALQQQPPAPTCVAVDVVARWRALLETRRRHLLTLTGQMSLYGELTILNLISPDAPLDATWWRGPLREPHDILTKTRAIEVKTIGRTSASIEIHGIHQMEPPGLPLALVIITLEESASGSTLPELVTRILERATDRGEMMRRLGAAGYSQSDSDDYQERFDTVGIAHVEVTNAVPRVVPDSFADGVPPEGVSRLVYSIDLRTLDPLVARGIGSLLEWVTAKS